MFTKTSELRNAREILAARTDQPEPGTILYALDKRPIRVRYQLRARKNRAEKELFSYATITHDPKDGHFVARYFGDSEFSGTKAILLANARNRLAAVYRDEPMLRDCEYLPVKALRVLGISKTRMSITCEIAEYCSVDESDLCAALVATSLQEYPWVVALKEFYTELSSL